MMKKLTKAESVAALNSAGKWWRLMIAGTCLASLVGRAAVVPANLAGRVASPNALPWQGVVGIPGGVPNRTVIFADASKSPYNADPTGVLDATSAIQSAINACPSNQVVYLPAGRYKITST